MKLFYMAALIILATLSTTKADEIDYEVLGPFNPSNVPFVSDKDRETIAGYFVGDNKAGFTLAVCERGCWSLEWATSWSTQDRIRSALQRCEHIAQEACGLAAVDGKIVAFRPQPGQITYPEEFNSDAVPFVRRKYLARIHSQYAIKSRHRALAINSNGAYGYAYNQPSEDKARAEALAWCRRSSEGKGYCFLYDINGTVVFQPMTDIFGRQD